MDSKDVLMEPKEAQEILTKYKTLCEVQISNLHKSYEGMIEPEWVLQEVVSFKNLIKAIDRANESLSKEEDNQDVGKKNSGTYECFHCLSNSVVWGSDFDFEDFGYEGEGIVHCCTCANCGAEIEYRVPIKSGEDDE